MSSIGPPRPLLILSLALLCFWLSPLPFAQESERDSGSQVDGYSARELWDQMCAATLLRSKRDPNPVTALDLYFNVLTRGDQGSNEFKPRVRWMSPSLIRFELESGRELGRGSDGDWLRDGDEVIRLVGRDYAEDRRKIDEYLTIVKNFVALTHPSGLQVENLTRVPEIEFAFTKRHALDRVKLRKRLVWLRFESPDLRLPGSNKRSAAGAERHRIHIAIDTADRLPVMALIADPEHGSSPVLLSLSQARILDDLRVPRRIHIYPLHLDRTGTSNRWIVAERPAQEFDILGGTVRAKLSEADFTRK